MKDSQRRAMFANKNKSNYIHTSKELSFGNPRIIDKSQSFKDSQQKTIHTKRMSNNSSCKQCHGKGFYMEDDLVGNYTQFDCDCGGEE